MEEYFTQTFDLQKHTELKDLGKKLKSSFNSKLNYQGLAYTKELRVNNKNIFGLTKKESIILRARFGIGFNQNYTHKQIGNKLHLTKERIRQVECRALRKLRHPTNLKILIQYGDIFGL